MKSRVNALTFFVFCKSIKANIHPEYSVSLVLFTLYFKIFSFCKWLYTAQYKKSSLFPIRNNFCFLKKLQILSAISLNTNVVSVVGNKMLRIISDCCFYMKLCFNFKEYGIYVCLLYIIHKYYMNFPITC